MEPRKHTEDDTYVLLEFSPRKQVKIKKEGDESSQIMVKQEGEGSSQIMVKQESDGSSHSEQQHNVADSQIAAKIAKIQQKANELGAREVELNRECNELKVCIDKENLAIEQTKFEVAAKTEDVKRAIAAMNEKIQSVNEASNDENLVKFMSAIGTANATFKMGDDLRPVMVVKGFRRLVDCSFAAMRRVLNDKTTSKRGWSINEKMERGKSFIERVKNRMDTSAKVVKDLLKDDLVRRVLGHQANLGGNTEVQQDLQPQNGPMAEADDFRAETTDFGERLEELQGLYIENQKCRKLVAAEDNAISILTDAVKQATKNADRLIREHRTAKAYTLIKLIPAGIELIFEVHERMLFYKDSWAGLEAHVSRDLQDMGFQDEDENEDEEDSREEDKGSEH
ncbi:hypothetical protein HDK77DRAFT_426768 [Phyllosticta capitalensis]|uniref:Uncharacterized protein n=1 Tax=Phyllosticta capitalensis TaxID=121624 RepID=A0ABR1YNT0_9PEZI